MDATSKTPGAGGRRGFQDHAYPSALRQLYQGNPRVEFAEAIRAAGIGITEPDRIVADGKITRFHVEGDRGGTRNGWAVLFADAHGMGGAFGHWRASVTSTWRSGRGKITAAERKRLSAAIADARAERERVQRQREADAAARAVELWSQAGKAHPSHRYLLHKCVEAHGIRQLGDKLVIPLRDTAGKLHSLQFIGPDGSKRFLSGGRKRGLYHAIGGAVGDELLIAEGYATAASVHEATFKPVAVAFDCGNLEPIAKALRAKYPRVAITLCADNDAGTEGNPGLTAANAAARAVGGKVAIPPHGFKDFNDAAVAEVRA